MKLFNNLDAMKYKKGHESITKLVLDIAREYYSNKSSKRGCETYNNCLFKKQCETSQGKFHVNLYRG